MILRTGWAGLAALSLPLLASAEDATLQRKVDEQEQRILVLERKLEIQDEAATAAATNATVKASPKGFQIATPDGANVIKFRANLAVDGRVFSDDVTPNTANTFLFRRARPYVEGTIGGLYDFRLMPEFAGGRSIVQDAYVAGKFKPGFVVQVGKFKGPVGLERLQPDQYNRFMELGLPSSLVPNRDLGVQIGGDLNGGVLSYAIGYFNGTTDGASTDANATPDVDNDGKKDIAARVFSQPFVNSGNFFLRGFGIGIGGTYVNTTGSATSTLLPSYRTPGQQSFFAYRGGATATFADGTRQRLAPQVYYYLGSLGFIGEYVESSQEVSRQVSPTVLRSAEFGNTAWQASFSWFLTGEDASYASFTPNTRFQVGKPGWGAWEVVVRIHELKVDDDAFAGGADSFADPATAARRARAAGIGVNWYLSQNFKWMLDYERTRFDGGAAAGDRPDEKALLTRFSLVF